MRFRQLYTQVSRPHAGEDAMGFYQTRILPRIIDLSMRNRDLASYRERVLSVAEGRVLEVGIGSGLNLPFYGSRVTHVVGLEPAPRLLAMTREAVYRQEIPVELISASGESIPLPHDQFDTVVTTWTLCSIPAVSVALNEMRRVLKPTGRLLFVEYGRAPEESVRKWQDRLTPVWKRIGGGCHLNRPIRELIEGAGFTIEHLQTGYMRGPKPMTYMYEGRAIAK
jgi:ubiquinone/menaquinone biosynthesis C-methylase UbiE